MNRPFLAAFASLAVVATAAGAYVIASPGGDEETVQQVETATATASPVGTPAASASPDVSPTPTSTQAATLTYTDPTYGYSFDYPNSWFLSPQLNGVILYSYDLASVAPGDAGKPVPIDKLKVFVWVAEGQDKPLEDWLNEREAQATAEHGLPAAAVISLSAVSLGGKPGLMRVTGDDGYRGISYYVPIGGGRVFVVNSGPAGSLDRPEFEPVLGSVRFAP